MTNPEKVYTFLKSNPHQMLCDDCLGKKAGVDRHEVNTVASTLALFPVEFRRVSNACVEKCSARDKMVTEAV